MFTDETCWTPIVCAPFRMLSQLAPQATFGSFVFDFVPFEGWDMWCTYIFVWLCAHGTKAQCQGTIASFFYLIFQD